MSFFKIITPKAFVELAQRETSRRVIPVDSTWYLPNVGRDGKQEFLELDRIPKSVFFDIDAVKDVKSPYPHMVPDLSTFNHSMGELGLKRDDILVVYDRIGNFSAPRCAWTLAIFGHPSVYLLNNYNLYKKLGYPVENDKRTKWSELNPTEYKSDVDLASQRVVSYETMLQLVSSGELSKRFNVFDARPVGRFDGSAPEPRPGLSSGHIEGAQPLPFGALLDQDTGALPESPELMRARLDKALTELHDNYNPSLPTIAMCGTGVTACIVMAALEYSGIRDVRLYDGSWTEWVMRSDPKMISKGRN